jgi:hypothetical protein
MILDAIAGLLLGVLNGVLGLFPAYSLPSSMTDFSASVGSWVGSANGFFPVVTLGVCIGVILAARAFVLAVRLVVFVYDLIPLKFT